MDRFDDDHDDDGSSMMQFQYASPRIDDPRSSPNFGTKHMFDRSRIETSHLPSPPKSFLEQLRDRGLIKPDGHEQDQIQHMLNRAVSRAFDQNRHGRTVIDRNGLLAHERCVEARDAMEERSAHARPQPQPVEVHGDDADADENGGGGIGWASALALLGLGWFLASFASEGK